MANTYTVLFELQKKQIKNVFPCEYIYICISSFFTLLIYFDSCIFVKVYVIWGK